jgi:ectoine hydroxylase-related dioxygenase (phytanoyl-CoA dioxygenase family)
MREPAGGRSTIPVPVDVEEYQRDGFLVLDDVLEPEELKALRRESVSLCRGERGSVGGLEAPTANMSDDDVVRRVLCIHFPHKLSPLMSELLALPRIVGVLTQLIGPDVKAMQSMLFLKAAGKPGQAWHQDEYFIPTRDRSLTAAWIALDDATTENGCLWVLPGSHRRGVIYPEREIDDTRFDCSTEAYHFPYEDSEAIPVEVPAGGAIIFDGYLLHRSLPNVAKRGLRRAIANHYMSAQSLLPWRAPREGEHMAMVDDRDVVLVAGKDPYAYKGLEENHKARLRPDREGGCDR